MNEASYANYGWDCRRIQSYFSNSYTSGYSKPIETPSTGRPTHKSNAGTTATDMGGYSGSNNDGTGNLLQTSNYAQILKWGDFATKWKDGGTGLTEKGWRYEGDKVENSLSLQGIWSTTLLRL